MSEKSAVFVVIRLTEHGDGIDIDSVHDNFDAAQEMAKKVSGFVGTKNVLVRQVPFFTSH